MVIEPPNKETVHSGPSRFCFVHFRDSLILITVLNRITAIMNLKVKVNDADKVTPKATETEIEEAEM